MQDIKSYSSFKTKQLLTKGWSDDKKYYIETYDGEKRLLRTAHISQYDKKYDEFLVMKQLAHLNLPMSQPLEFGICQNGELVYTIFTWCDGEDAEVVLPTLSEEQQYQLGIKAGQLLRTIHQIPAPIERERWEEYFNRKANKKLEMYRNCGMTIAGEQEFITYIENNRHLLNNKTQTFHHGDYHVGNMIISETGELYIIDFNRYDYGEPWEEFNRIVWSATASPHFATGQINGYFNGEPPNEFFKLLAFYIAVNTISSLPWAIPFGEKQINVFIKQAQDILSWFDQMANPVPTWYITK